MRDIRFRAKRIQYGSWYYGSLLTCEDGKAAIITARHTWATTHVEVDHKTIGQFTGLHDKHGREIYEGDIIKWLQVSHATRNVMEPPEDYIEECMDVVVFGAGAFTVEEEMYPDMAFICKEGHYNETDLFTWVCNLDDFPGITTDDMYICDIVGNIHDDPNLIEEGGQNGQTEI